VARFETEHPPAALVEDYSARLYRYLARNLVPGPLTYGFEYEFLPGEVMTPGRLSEVAACLPELGFKLLTDGSFGDADGLHIDFEPGGQLEYGSPPLLAGERERFLALVEHLTRTNARLEELCGIRYEARPYVPGREEAPLCLTSPRYRAMHELFTVNRGRGREMMKATASIQLHVRIRRLSELLPLYRLLQRLAADGDFAMSPERRAIWDTTEPSRCLIAPPPAPLTTEMELLRHLVGHALRALDLERQVPFFHLEKTEFTAFLAHLTTIFTDVRLNLKGPTFELRTIDSLPAEAFVQRWFSFVSAVEEECG
jgi:glutamate--cysteine ligase